MQKPSPVVPAMVRQFMVPGCSQLPQSCPVLIPLALPGLSVPVLSEFPLHWEGKNTKCQLGELLTKRINAELSNVKGYGASETREDPFMNTRRPRSPSGWEV